MEPPRKKIKFCEKPLELKRIILGYIHTPDIKNARLVCKEFCRELSNLKKNNTYLYILQGKKFNVKDILSTERGFNEIFFHGPQAKEDVDVILNKFGSKLKMLSFGKSDLNFLKISSIEIIRLLSFCPFLTQLNTINIELTNLTCDSIIPLVSLKKLRCGDTMLSKIHAPNLEKLKVFTTDRLTHQKLSAMNKFFRRHHAIKYLAYTIYNGEDTDIQNCAFDLSHLNLENLRFMEFRYNIHDVIEIIRNQPNLIELRLEDGCYTESTEDTTRIMSLQLLFDEMLKLKKLEKLYIEMPSDEMMRKIPIYLENLKVLKVCSITEEMLDTFKLIANPNIEKLCIENVDHGKKHLSVNHIESLAKSYPNLKSFKADTLPPTVLSSISMQMNLKKIKIIRNEYLPQKMKKAFSESVVMQESSLERITCKCEDYKLRILPLIQASPKLRHVKIYWDNKNTPFMQIIYEIIMACPMCELIDFPFDGVYIKANMIPFTQSFYFSFNNYQFELLISRKKGKIICKKIH